MGHDDDIHKVFSDSGSIKPPAELAARIIERGKCRRREMEGAYRSKTVVWHRFFIVALLLSAAFFLGLSVNNLTDTSGSRAIHHLAELSDDIMISEYEMSAARGRYPGYTPVVYLVAVGVLWTILAVISGVNPERTVEPITDDEDIRDFFGSLVKSIKCPPELSSGILANSEDYAYAARWKIFRTTLYAGVLISCLAVGYIGCSSATGLQLIRSEILSEHIIISPDMYLAASSIHQSVTKAMLYISLMLAIPLFLITMTLEKLLFAHVD